MTYTQPQIDSDFNIIPHTAIVFGSGKDSPLAS
jgi:hypothetical protein